MCFLLHQRLVVAAETLEEAERWRAALELQIAVREGRRPKPAAEMGAQLERMAEAVL